MPGTSAISKLLAEGTRVTKSGGLLFLLLGDVNMQWHHEELIRIGWIALSIVPIQESRAIHIYLKKADSVTENPIHKSILVVIHENVFQSVRISRRGEHDQIKVTFIFECNPPRICIIHHSIIVTYDVSMRKVVGVEHFP